MEPSVLHPEGIGAAGADHRLRAPVGQPGCRRLMWHRHVGAGQAPGPEVISSPAHAAVVNPAPVVGALEPGKLQGGGVDDRG